MPSPHNIRHDLLNHALTRETAVQRQAQQSVIAPSPNGTRRFMRGQRVLSPAGNNPGTFPIPIHSNIVSHATTPVRVQQNKYLLDDVEDTYSQVPRMGNPNDLDNFDDLEDSINIAARNHPSPVRDDALFNDYGQQLVDCTCDTGSDGKVAHRSDCHIFKEMQEIFNLNIAQEVEVRTASPDSHIVSFIRIFNFCLGL